MKLIKYFFIISFISAFKIVNGQDNTHYPFECTSPWKLNFQVSPLLTQLKSDTYSNEEKSRPGFDGGLHLVYYFKNSGKLKLGVSIGAEYSVYNAKRNINYNDSAWTTDAGGDQVHVYEQGTISEKQKVTCVTIPLQLHFDYAITDQIGAYFNAGYYFSLMSSGKYTSDAVLSRQGYYPRYNVLIYDVDVEGSDYFYPTDKPLSDTRSLKLNNSNGIVASMGIKYRLSPKFSLFAGLKTSIGLNNISGYSSDNAVTIANNSTEINTLMSRGDKIKANAFGLEIGLTVNIGHCNRHKVTSENTGSEEIPVTENQLIKEDTVARLIVAESKRDTIISTPVIEGKDDITKVPEPIELAFTNENKEIVNPPVNYNPRRVYTLEETNRLMQQGISIKKKYTVLQRIEFEFNTEKLTKESEKYLDQLVEFMRLQPDCYAKIIGHTDNEGTKEYNQALSEKRAASVMAYLISKGVDKYRLSSAGYGVDKPIDDNNTPEGREKNRRVEFEISWK